MMAKQMEVKMRILKFENCFVVDRCGLGGGLALLWTSDVSLEVKSYSKHHIDSVIHNENGSSWRCTGVYGHPESERKKTYLVAVTKASRYVILAMALFWRF
ncbi:hypothetical protein AB3S75_018993 [Citrus x aurantiifolia]